MHQRRRLDWVDIHSFSKLRKLNQSTQSILGVSLPDDNDGTLKERALLVCVIRFRVSSLRIQKSQLPRLLLHYHTSVSVSHKDLSLSIVRIK
jgi:hypothetical protein